MTRSTSFRHSNPLLTCALLIATLVAGSGRASADQPDRCEVYNCGSNTPDLRGTIINGLSTDGVFNRDRVRIVPWSLQLSPKSRCRTFSLGYEIPLTLRVRDGALVGQGFLGKGPLVDYPAACLIGATFQIEAPTACPTLRTDGNVRPCPMEVTTILIAESKSVSTWETKKSLRMQVPTYRLVDKAKETSLCDGQEAYGWMSRWQVGGLPGGSDSNRIDNPPGITGVPWREATDHALIVQGETYDLSASIDRQYSGPSWFNIACAGSAIAKMRLLGLDPMGLEPNRTPSTPGERQATLKMITAKYQGEQSHTVAGMPLTWRSARGIGYYGTPAGAGPFEAMWGSQGALCVSHLRLWRVPAPPISAPGLPNFGFHVEKPWEKYILAVERFQNLVADHTTEAGHIKKGLRPLSSCAGVTAPPEVFWTTETAEHHD
jgi:hypothetical protein